MSKVTSLNQAIENYIELLKQPKYRNYKEVLKICEKLMCQACIFKLFALGEDKDSVASGTRQDEKTVRFQRDGDQASLRSVALYKNYLRRRKGRKA